jgi:hypothetical protein
MPHKIRPRTTEDYRLGRPRVDREREFAKLWQDFEDWFGKQRDLPALMASNTPTGADARNRVKSFIILTDLHYMRGKI